VLTLDVPVSKKSSNRGSTASVGRVGKLRVEYVRQYHKTIIARSRCTSPWHLLPPIYPDDSGLAYTLLLNPSGGLVGGDRLSIEMTLGADARVLISTPSANRVYRSLAEASVQSVEISVGPGAVLEWVPEPTIPFAGSRFQQVIHVSLSPGATVLLWDVIASGRIAKGERWAFASLENEIRISTASGASVLERYDLTPCQERGRVGLADAWDYVGSLYVIGDAVGADTWHRLESSLACLLDERPGRVLGGVSQPAAPGLVAKVLAHSAPDLNATREALWGAVRRELWGLPGAVLRVY